MKLAKNRLKLLTSEVLALTTVFSVRSSSKTERYSERVTLAESSAQLKFLPRLRWSFHSKSTWTSSSTSLRCLASKWTQLELWNVIKTIEFSIHLYIYHRLNLHFNTILQSIQSIPSMFSFSNTQPLMAPLFQNTPARWLTNTLLFLGQPSLSNAYPLSTHGSVHRIMASSQIGSQHLVTFNFQRPAAFNAFVAR